MENKNDKLGIMRHSLSHLMSMAMQEIYPQVGLGAGPSIENGFYQDYGLSETITPEILPRLEKRIKELIKENIKFEQHDVDFKEAYAFYEHDPYKTGFIDDLKTAGEKKVSFYRSGSFDNLCAGPHVETTREIDPEAFRLTSIAGAYWRGDEKNTMLTRIYGVAFETKEELDNYLKMLEEAEKRDHRKLNKNLEIYMAHEDLGQGLITLLPNGAVIAEELEKWAKETEEKLGYVRVFTPHICPEKLFKTSGHVPYYLESMFPPLRMSEKNDNEKEVFYLKPMNCAGHHLVFKSKMRSYRDLPLRIAEYGAVYRYEQSGELHGMMRVRGPIHQNDAHIFCTEEQAGEEFQKVMDLHKYYYGALGLTEKDYYLSFAIRDPKNKDKYAGDEALWEKAETIALQYIKKTNIPYEIETGGAAFYGPKIDFNIKTVTGKVFSASTNQLDFFLPKAFGLKYTDKDGQEKTPVCIHRAPLGAHVRFIAFLMERYAGAFPVWLAPEQVWLLPISEKHIEYANAVTEKLRAASIRVVAKNESETIGKKIRAGEQQKIPYLLVVGDKEIAASSVAVRQRGKGDLGAMKIEEFIEKITEEISNKS